MSSRLMIHSAAAEYAKSKGLEFHRNTIDNLSSGGSDNNPMSKSIKRFSDEPKLELTAEEREEGGIPKLFVYVPVRIQSECLMCHNKEGVDIFGDKKDGELVAAFGVSGSLQDLKSKETRTMFAAVMVGVIVIAVIVIVIQLLTRNLIFRPLREVVMQLKRVSQRDLSPIDTPALEAKIGSNDEVGQLARSFKATMDELRRVIREVHDSATAVASASTEISSSTEQMAAGASEQTSQAAEVASAVEEMTKTIIENSRNASDTAETAKQAKHAAEQGGLVVDETVEGMKRIADVVKQSASTVQELGKSSDQIGEIISVIDDIADQTNLLALNAAIEAARAGEQGRGFAVVADEVRKLAERTTKATKEIALMIKKIQTDTKDAVVSMEQGTLQVDEGIKLADKAGASLHEIVGISQKVTDMVTQIAAASEEQSRASEEISKNVEGISTVTGETAQATQQIARASEDLNRLTENLQQLVGRFKLSGGSSTRATEDRKKSVRRTNVHTKLYDEADVPRSHMVVRENGALLSREQ